MTRTDLPEEQCLDCSRKGQRLREVQEGRWECSFPECSHRVRVPALPDHARSHGDGTYHVLPTSLE